MNESGQRSRPWPGPGDAALTPSEPAAAADARDEAPTLRDFGTSMDAISFGFAATAILISIFLLMAIFEHLIRPQAFQAPAGSPRGRRRRGHPLARQTPEPAHGGDGAAGRGPVGADAGAAVPYVPRAAGAIAAALPQGGDVLAAT